MCCGEKVLWCWTLNQLGLYIDSDVIIRCKGRKKNSSCLSTETRSPNLLRRNCCITHLIIKSCHKKVKHGGIRETLTEVRGEYWWDTFLTDVWSVRNFVEYLSNLQNMPAWQSKSRVYSRWSRLCWTWAYICLFTCSTSRALHLELVHDLSTEAFIRCLRRFIASIYITSDNDKTFK